MLLTVIDLIETGEVTDGWVPYDVRLVSRFRDYWELVRERQRNAPDIPMPFHALGGPRDLVWTTYCSDGQPSKAKATTRQCKLDADLVSCLQDSGFRRRARETLIAVYFQPGEQIMLSARLNLPAPATSAVASLREDATAYKARQKMGRDSRFKSDVLAGYYFTCALTGYRLDTETSSIVQAAHIHQHALSGNDDPCNGLALTPDAHWLFDAGLWTAISDGDQLLVQVALGRFAESSPHGRLLADFHKQPLHFHPHARLRPDLMHFKWHQRSKFLG
jgi:putative restriction endonuclease